METKWIRLAQAEFEHTWQAIMLVGKVIILDSKSNIRSSISKSSRSASGVSITHVKTRKHSCGRICQLQLGRKMSSFAWDYACQAPPSCWLNNMITCILPDIISWLTLSGIFFMRYKCIHQCIMKFFILKYIFKYQKLYSMKIVTNNWDLSLLSSLNKSDV